MLGAAAPCPTEPSRMLPLTAPMLWGRSAFHVSLRHQRVCEPVPTRRDWRRRRGGRAAARTIQRVATEGIPVAGGSAAPLTGKLEDGATMGGGQTTTLFGLGAGGALT